MNLKDLAKIIKNTPLEWIEANAQPFTEYRCHECEELLLDWFEFPPPDDNRTEFCHTCYDLFEGTFSDADTTPYMRKFGDPEQVTTSTHIRFDLVALKALMDETEK